MLFSLINPSKTVNTNVNQGKTITVINWFKNVPNKKQCNFIQFNVATLYPSISLNLFNEAIHNYGKSDSDKAINQPWKLKSGDPNFDVPLG